MSQFIEVLGLLYPKKYAESWDNVGLLVEPIIDKQMKKLLLTNDLTEKVCEEAIQEQVELIISYHPPLFKPLKQVRGISGNWKERIVAKCIRNDIAIYSPHTIADAIQNGVNDYLLQPLQPSSLIPIEPNPEENFIGSGRKAILSIPLTVRDIVARLKIHLKTNHLRVSFNQDMDESKSNF